MKRVEYYQLPGLEHYYLEDSYVLDIETAANEVTFLLEVVLTEHHPLYQYPPVTEKYCYRKARLFFPQAHQISWVRKQIQSYTDANGEIDYGNIDEFYSAKGRYHLSGDWGELDIFSNPPVIQICAEKQLTDKSPLFFEKKYDKSPEVFTKIA